MNFLTRADRSLSIFTKTWHYLNLSKDSTQDVIQLKQRWADEILQHLNIRVRIKGDISQECPLIFVGNHMSYLDILLMIHLRSDISFVAKKEVSYWPAIGPAARRVNTIFVKRESRSSRQSAGEAIAQALVQEKKSIVIFPSGTTSLYEEKAWKKGAFKIAKRAGLPIQPFRLRYHPLREVAYINDDTFFTHLMHLSSLCEIVADVEFHSPVLVGNVEQECQRWQKWSQDFLSQ